MRSLGRKCRAHDSGLSLLHRSRLRRRPVVKSEEMEQAMHEIEADLVFGRGVETPRVRLRGLDADNDFTVVERKHIGRPRKIHELLMQLRDAAIGNQDDVYLWEGRQDAAGPRQSQAMLQCALRKFLQIANVDAVFSLGIPHPHLRTIVHKLEFAPAAVPLVSAAETVLARSSVLSFS